MKEPANLSPFAALSPREQKEQWIWWQCQHPESVPVTEEPLPLAELRLPQQLPKPDTADEPEPPKPPQAPRRPIYTAPTIRHGQYDAVIRRMKSAGQRTGSYTPWTE